jgi:type II secretory pathway pseudopilin PulG
MRRLRPPFEPRAGRARNGRGATQDGYALTFVLGVIALTSVVVVALLGLALTSARVARDQADLARETRAADGALESALTEVARASGDPCDVLGDTQRVVFPDGAAGQIPVDVRCTPNGTPNLAQPEDYLEGPRVEVVGTGATPYDGDVAPPAAAAQLTADPTLVATGTEPLLFASDVVVNQGASVGRTDGNGPALDVTGQYEQRVPVPGGGCGPLGAPGVNQILDHSGVPRCEPGVAEVVPTAPQPLAAPTVPVRSIVCPPAGGVLWLPAGSYTTQEARALNRVLDDCPGRTIWFMPGIHAIDVNDPANVPADRNALVIDDPDIRVVFGTPRGWSTTDPAQADDFPQACDPELSGATLELSGRTALRHRAGRVAMCPFVQGENRLPAIVQTDRVLATPELAAAPVVNRIGPADFLRPGSTSWAATDLCTNASFFNLFPFLKCDYAEFNTTWANIPPGPLSSVHLLLDAQQIPDTLGPDTPASAHAMVINVAFSVRAPNNTEICSTGAMSMGRSYDGTAAFDLRSGGCAAALTDGAQLEGATVAAYMLRFDNGDIRPMVVRMRNVRLEVNSAAAVASSVATTGAWTTPDGALVPGGSVASAVQDDTGTPSLRWATPGTEYSITLEDVTFPDGSITADSVLDALEVELRAPTNVENFLSDPVDGARMAFDVLDGGSRICGLEVDSHANSNRELRYDLFDGDCADQLATAGSVAGKDLRITFRTGCAQLSNFGTLPNLGDPSKCQDLDGHGPAAHQPGDGEHQRRRIGGCLLRRVR